MNKIIKDQLNKVRNVKIDINNSKIYIQKLDIIPSDRVNVGHFYRIKLLDNINNVKEMLMANYNSGRHPKEELYTVEVVNILGRMLKLDMVSDNDRFFGWIPNDCFEVVEEVK